MGNFDFGGDFDPDEKSLGTDFTDTVPNPDRWEVPPQHDPEFPDDEFDCLDDWDEEEYQ